MKCVSCLKAVQRKVEQVDTIIHNKGQIVQQVSAQRVIEGLTAVILLYPELSYCFDIHPNSFFVYFKVQGSNAPSLGCITSVILSHLVISESTGGTASWLKLGTIQVVSVILKITAVCTWSKSSCTICPIITASLKGPGCIKLSFY